MEVLSILALLLLTMVGYSSGATIAAGRGRSTAPGLLDLGLLLALWILALLTRPDLGKWQSVLIWVTVAAILAGFLTRIRIGPKPAGEPKPKKKRESSWWRSSWEGWKSFAAEMGNYQGRLLLAAFYFIVLAPWGLMVRLLSDPLRTRTTSSSSHWTERNTFSPDMEEAKRQF
jgi:hypothetical protein